MFQKKKPLIQSHKILERLSLQNFDKLFKICFESKILDFI